jgi:hypothetical protein
MNQIYIKIKNKDFSLKISNVIENQKVNSLKISRNCIHLFIFL